MNTILVFGYAVCATLVHWGDPKHPGDPEPPDDLSWMYNANDNAQAFADMLAGDEYPGLSASCIQEDLCNGAPAICTLEDPYTFFVERPMCWDHDGNVGCMENTFAYVPVLTITCSNVLNCSHFGKMIEFGPYPDPNDCCQIVEPSNA